MIYTTSKVRIKNYQATIDKTIILYRGDRNVEIQFEILESAYREYKVEGTNVILNLNASYGQLIVQKPDNTHILSDIVPTQDGKVIFTIPEKLIDETLEVGKYTFQIRLYNGDRTSRVTLPPVVGGMEIAEPIAIDESFVDTAMVGYARAQTDSEDEEDKRFDENGNYIKTYWKHGDVITAGKLNKVEDSLEVINANDIQNHIDVNEKIDALVESIDAAEYVTETELNAKGYLTEHQDISHLAEKSELPTKTSQLTNDSNFLTEHQDISHLAEKSELPTKTSQLTNDSNFLTEHQDISGKADKTELHNHTNKAVLDGITSAKITSWDNKSTFNGDYNSLTNKPMIPSIAGLASETYVNEYVENAIKDIPKEEIDLSEYVTETELNTKGYLTEHQDISGKADKVTGVFYIEGDSTTDGVWTGRHKDITEYYSGLMINYKTNVAGISDGSTLNINNLGAVKVVRNVSTAITTVYGVGSIINLTYTVDGDTAYWKTADYDVNTKTTTGTSKKTGSKMYIVGATSQSSSGTTTYTNTNCYIGTDDKLYSNGNKVIDTSDMTDRDRLHISLIPSGANIPANSDLNTIDFVKVGSYKCGKNADAKTLLNSPTKKGFMMEVCSPLSTTLDNEATETWVYRVRTIMDYNGDEWRQYTYSDGTAGHFIYGGWQKVARFDDIPTKTSQLTNDSNFITSENINSLFDIDYDSLLAFDTNEIITNSNYVDNNNNIILDDDLPSGMYTLKYEFEDGTFTDIKNFIIKNEPSGALVNLLEEGVIYLNKTFDRDNVTLEDFPGTVTIALPIDFDGKTQCTLKIQNSPRSLKTYKDYNVLAFTDVNMTTMSYVNGSTHFGYMDEGCWTVSDDGKSLGVCEFTPPADKQIMYLSLRIKHNGDDLTITEADFGNLNITLVIEGGITK